MGSVWIGVEEDCKLSEEVRGRTTHLSEAADSVIDLQLCPLQSLQILPDALKVIGARLFLRVLLQCRVNDPQFPVNVSAQVTRFAERSHFSNRPDKRIKLLRSGLGGDESGTRYLSGWCRGRR